MIPPEFERIIDRHGGFTIESQMPSYMRTSHRHSGLKTPGRFDMEARQAAQQRHGMGRLPIGPTLWRPGHVLKGDTVGKLLGYDESSFYQTNNNVTIAIYRIPGYGYPILCWYDNATGERIA